MPSLQIATAGYLMTQGKDVIKSYTAPLLYEPPVYETLFCSKCGSPVPSPNPSGDMLEIPAGLLDDDPGISPDKHIFVELLPKWDQILDGLPQYDLKRLVRERHGYDLPDDFRLRTHYDED